MRAKGDSMTEVLRRAIAESGKALIALERETGIQRMSLSRFVAGKRSLRLDVADKLAAYFGLVLRPDQRPSRKRGRGKAGP
jgi:plasmid maintenance system antidote protein VapI